jgi:hypothetical protein
MLVFEDSNGIKKVFIHIPKNSGKYVRKLLIQKYKIIQRFWGIKSSIDTAHIPYLLRNKFLGVDSGDFEYFSYTRNPYHRLISGFYYIYGKAYGYKNTPHYFKAFCIQVLPKLSFDTNFSNVHIIHFYPQYLFLCDDDETFTVKVETKKLEDDPETFNMREYDLKSYFNDNKVLEIVNKIYARDFEEFGYDKLFLENK